MNANQQVAPRDDARTALMAMESQFALALPPHIPAERFMRVVLTAVNGNPDLLTADRVSLFESAMKAAQDGLLPDGRDGAFVVFKTKDKRTDRYVNKVQWMPMIGGILKKVRNSGELKSISAYVVYENDVFKYRLGDDEKIEHEPTLEDPGAPKLVYAIAHTKDGGVYREVMTLKQVEKVRNVSRAKDSGPWVTWWDEMARKTVLKRLAKRLPTSADLDDLLRQDDELYDFKGQRAEQAPFTPVKHPLKDDVKQAIEHDGASQEESQVDLVIDKDGKVLKASGAITSGPLAIVDRRYEDPNFDSYEEWSRTCEENDMLYHFDAKGNLTQAPETASNEGAKINETAAGGTEAAGSGAKSSGAPAPADDESAPAASGSPANGKSDAKAAKAAPAKPYTDGTSYVTWITSQFEAAKSKAAVTDIWGSTRTDRLELCSAKQVEELGTLKETTLKRLARS